jgi:Amt family ammonium transporter
MAIMRRITDKAKIGHLLYVLILPMMVTPLAFAADPTGDITFAGDPNTAVNFTWTLIAAFLVFLMQGGFAMVEGGLVRAKNVGNIMMKNLMDFSVGSLGYWSIGFPLMFGASVAGIFGASNWLLFGEAYDVNTYLLWFFQMVFAGTAATITSGAMAERTKFSTYLIISFMLTTFIYPIYGHWVWGGGWLSTLPFAAGHVDFAGSGVVHMVGGGAGLAGAMLLGPRIGKYDKNGKPRAIP